jgi:hypothetical protein
MNASDSRFVGNMKVTNGDGTTCQMGKDACKLVWIQISYLWADNVGRREETYIRIFRKRVCTRLLSEVVGSRINIIQAPFGTSSSFESQQYHTTLTRLPQEGQPDRSRLTSLHRTNG